MFEKCLLLRNSARRTVVEAQFSLDDPLRSSATLELNTRQEVPEEGAQGDLVPGDGPISSQSQESQQPEGRDGLNREDDTDQTVFDAIELGESSERAIEALGGDEDVLALMPAAEFVIAHGPKQTVLYWLCQDAEMTVKINDFLEGDRFVDDRSSALIIIPIPSHPNFT